MGAVLAQSTSGPGLGLPIGGFITLALLIVTFLLIKNMAGRLNRLPRSFDPAPPPEPAAPADPADKAARPLGPATDSGSA